MSDNKKSGWYYLFVGCGVLFLAAVIVLGAGIFMAVRWGNNLKDELEDPVLRATKAREFLSAETLPEGYHAAVHLSAPLGLGRMVVLTDGEPTDRPGDLSDSDHLFVYMQGPGWDSDWKKFLAGGDPPFDHLGDLNINIDSRQRLATGQVTVGNMEVFYAANRGEISGEGFHSDDGVFSVMLIRCPGGDKRSRTIIWSGPVNDEASGSVAGTPGDPEGIAEMLGHFRLCG